MLLSKQNLEICKVSEQDKGIAVLNNICVTRDGATLAANSKSFMCVSPVTEAIKNSVPLDKGSDLEEFSISSGLCKEIIRALPVDTQFNGLTEHVSVSEKDQELEFTMTDGRRKKLIRGKKYERKWIEYKEFLRKIFSGHRKIRLTLNRKRLLALLTSMESICQDRTGHGIAYMEVTDNDEIILRSMNPRTGQHCAAFMSSYKNEEEQWIEDSQWELSQKKETAKIIKKT